jgi:hypothetical protein
MVGDLGRDQVVPLALHMDERDPTRMSNTSDPHERNLNAGARTARAGVAQQASAMKAPFRTLNVVKASFMALPTRAGQCFMLSNMPGS